MPTMGLSEQWTKGGAIAGVWGVLCYFAAAVLPLPHIISLLCAFHFGILLSISFVGIYYFFKHYRINAFSIRVACLLGIIAGVVVTVMVVVQQSVFSFMNSWALRLQPEADKILTKQIVNGLNSVQLGMDVAWDLFISWAGVMLGIAMLEHPKFGRIFGGITVTLSAALLIFNIAAFPVPPSEVSLIDLGPFVGVWYLVIFLRMGYVAWLSEEDFRPTLSNQDFTHTSVLL